MQKVPQLTERSCREYFSRLSPKLAEQGITPAHIVRLRDAVYCREKHIPLLTPEAAYSVISKRDDYMDAQMGYGAYIPELKGVLPDFHACNAVEFPEGVLLFSPTVKGDKMLQTLMREIASDFFDPKMNKSYMKFYQLPLFDLPLRDQVDKWRPPLINDNSGLAEPDRITTGYLDKSVLRNGIPTGEFDLSPTPKAFWELARAGSFGHKRFDNEETNQVIAHLLYIKEHGQLPDPKISGICHTAQALVYFFRDEGPEALKAKAGELLKLDCPTLRQPPPKQIRHVQAVSSKNNMRLSFT